jgi:death-on-curing protein
MIRLTVDSVIELHSRLIQETGGADGIRDFNLLDSAVAASFQIFSGADLYPSLEEKAAHIGFSLVKNHPFIDGNKRTGIAAMLVFLKANGIDVRCDDGELVALGLGLADGSFDQGSVRQWIVNHR